MINNIVVSIKVHDIANTDKCTLINGSYYANKDKSGNAQYCNVRCILLSDYIRGKAVNINVKDKLLVSGKIGNVEVKDYKGRTNPVIIIWAQSLELLAPDEQERNAMCDLQNGTGPDLNSIEGFEVGEEPKYSPSFTRRVY